MGKELSPTFASTISREKIEGRGGGEEGGWDSKFASFGSGFRCAQFLPWPLTSAKLCRPLAEEVTFFARLAGRHGQTVKSL